MVICYGYRMYVKIYLHHTFINSGNKLSIWSTRVVSPRHQRANNHILFPGPGGDGDHHGGDGDGDGDGQTTTSSSQDLVEHTRVNFRYFFAELLSCLVVFHCLGRWWCPVVCLHAVCVEESNVGEVLRVRPVRQAQHQLPLDAAQTVDCLGRRGAFKNGGFLNGSAQEFHSQSGLAMGKKGKSQPCRANLRWTRGRYRRWPLASSSLDSPPGSGHLDVTALVANTRRKKNLGKVFS